MMRLVFELITILAVLTLGFALGRIWEIRQHCLKSGDAKRPTSGGFRPRTFPCIRRQVKFALPRIFTASFAVSYTHATTYCPI
jgi:hypothetical protein